MIGKVISHYKFPTIWINADENFIRKDRCTEEVGKVAESRLIGKAVYMSVLYAIFHFTSALNRHFLAQFRDFFSWGR